MQSFFIQKRLKDVILFSILIVGFAGCRNSSHQNHLSLISPVNGSEIHNNMPLLSWSSVSCRKYEIWIDDIKMDELDSSKTSYCAFPLSFGKHTWKVIALNEKGKTESAGGDFSVANEPMTHLSREAMLLRENWKVRSSLLVKENGQQLSSSNVNTDEWNTTSIPATVLTTLVRNGVYPNPYVGLNNMLIPDCSDSFNIKNDLLKYSHIQGQNPWQAPYWFRTKFNAPEDYSGKTVWLNFGEINYKAEVWLNGEQIADTTMMKGMERSFRFDISSMLKKDENILAVAIYPPDHPGQPAVPPVTPLAPPGRNLGADALITKDYTKWDVLGWDWQPAIRDRDMGIVGDVYLSATDDIELDDLYVTSDLTLPDTTSAELTISAEIVNHSSDSREGIITTTIRIDGQDLSFDHKFVVGPNERQQIYFDSHSQQELHLEAPKLWWPVGYGDPNLYQIKMELKSQSGDTATIEDRFGIREVETYIGSNERVYKINGKDIYCKGGNWVEDMMLNWTAERYRQEILLTKNANLNLLRIWGPTGAPPEAFYDAADENGILLWQDFLNDFWGTFKNTPGYQPNKELFEQATTEIVKKYRNHPSLVIWCGGNEGVNPREDLIRKILAKYDGRDSRHYLRSSNGDGLHGGGPYHTLYPAEYFKHPKITGFSSEIGPSGVPVYESMEKFITDLSENWKPGQFPINAQWTYHDATDRTEDDPRRFSAYDEIVRDSYGAPDSLNSKGVKDYLKKCQLVNYDVYRAAIEAVNSQLWTQSSGFALWKSNSSWPSVTWQVYDWYMQAHGGYYGTRKASEPVHVQLNRDDMQVVVLNAKNNDIEGARISAKLYNKNMHIVWDADSSLTLKGNMVTPTGWQIPSSKEVMFLRLLVTNKEGNVISNNFYWLNSDDNFQSLNQLPPAKLKGKLQLKQKGKTSRYQVRLTNEEKYLAFVISLKLIDKKSGKEILPSYWSDNYVSLLPGESVDLHVEINEQDQGNVSLQTEAFNMPGATIIADEEK